jgi:dihydroorotate dehydrogenase (fumarate)
MDLTTNFLGLKLAHPFMPGASPLVDELDNVKKLADAGASAIVMRSLFEEQIAREAVSTFVHTETHGQSFAEALTYFPSPDSFVLGPDDYLEHIRRIKGSTPGGWLDYARLMEQAGANALELNIYAVATNPEETAKAIEDRILEMVKAVKGAVKIPLAVKLSPFYTSLVNFGKRLDEVGADGIVIFNRFYQPDIDPNELQVRRVLHLSTSAELPMRLHWLGILFGKVKASLAATGGVHTGMDAIQALMSGASAVQLVSALLKRGPQYLKSVKEEVEHWMEEKEYASMQQMIGSMSLKSCPDPSVYERANYMLLLQSWKTGLVDRGAY